MERPRKVGSMRISIIVAAAMNGVIGDKGDMPWRMPSDLKHFRALTMGKPVIMGRKTFQSLPKALDGRDNIVVSRDASFAPPGAVVVASLDAAVELAREKATARGCDEIMIIGGGQIYAAALPIAGRVYLTRVEATLRGDTAFPDLPPGDWVLAAREPMQQGPKDQFAATFETWDRRGR